MAKEKLSRICSPKERQCEAFNHSGYYSSWAESLQLHYHDILYPGDMAKFRYTAEVVLTPEMLHQVVAIIRAI